MSNVEMFKDALKPLLEVVATIDPADPSAKALLDEKLPPTGPVVAGVAKLMREGVEAGWICDREAGGVKFSRVQKANDGGSLSVDAVHMSAPGPGHTHPNGEIDLCFAVDGEPRFDGNAPGWTVYPPGSWHVPTVEGGVMDILYFLPGGAIRFEEKPA